jgi:hypothetical protein
MIEPTDETEQPVVTIATMAERFWVGKPSHWQSSHERSLAPAEVLESDLAAMVRQHIADGQAEISKST